MLSSFVRGDCSARGDVPVYAGDVAADTSKLALRDRNHASVAWYSLCNELGCGPGTLLANDTAAQCTDAMHAVDSSRVITGNWAWQSPQAVSPTSEIAGFLEVMGMSHQRSDKLTAWHAARPDKLVVMTECCSCETQRGEDADLLPFSNRSAVYFSNENAACVEEQTQTSNAIEWVGGTFVWTLHDYYGEPGAWPHISSSFGSFDLAGFPKAPAWWYRSWWLAHIDAMDAGRPPLSIEQTSYFCRIAESWEPSPNGTTRDLNVYTNAPFVRISVNGAAIPQSPTAVQPYGSAVIKGVEFVPGTVTADCVESSAETATPLASDTKQSWGQGNRIVLSLDAPSPRTGTGSRLYLDGADVALVRASVVDANGNVVHNSSSNITFVVEEGPGRIAGVGNGDPADHNPNHASWKTAYHGLARAIVKVTLLAIGSDESRDLVSAVNVDQGRGLSSRVSIGAERPPTSLTVSATAPDLPPSRVTIPLSTNPMDAPLKVASASVSVADIGQ